MSLPMAFHDIAAADFPLTIELIAEDNGDVLFKVTADGPGAVKIPGFAPRKVASRLSTPRWMMYLDSAGEVIWSVER